MDYYTRKRLAQELVKKMLDEFEDKEICFAVEDKFQLSFNSIQKYIDRLRDR